jgi:putative ABC transport system permease protein
MRALLHTIGARLRGFLRPGRLDAEFDEEMTAHLAMAEEDGVRRGLTREEAHRVARVRLGGLTQLREANSSSGIV